MCQADTTTAIPSACKNNNHEYITEWKEQFKTAWPTLCGMVLYKIPWLISLRFVGTLGTEELASAALATTLCNVTGLSLSVGLSSAMTTLTGQARGHLLQKGGKVEDQQPLLITSKTSASDDSTTIYSSTTQQDKITTFNSKPKVLLPMVFLYRGLVVQMLFVIPVGLWWLSGVESCLSALGQSPEISRMTSVYLRILTPGLWAYSISWTITTWLQSIEMADVPAYAATLGLISHVPLNYFFVYGLKMGYLGCAVATTCFQLIQPVFVLVYLFGTNHGRCRVLEKTVAKAIGRTCLFNAVCADLRLAVSLDGILMYLRLGIPGIVTISEWWASEISIFLSGRLQPNPEVALGGMTLYQSINTFCFMFPVASAIAGSARVGNLLGSGDTAKAATAGKVSVASSAMISGLIGLVLFLTPHTFFPSLFVPGAAVVDQTSHTIPLLASYVFADGVQVALNGIIKGCGNQILTMPVVIISYWVVGLPIAYYLSFIRHKGEMCDELFCGDVGLVTGMTSGTWVHMLSLAIVVFRTDWLEETRKAKERMASHECDSSETGSDVEEENALDVELPAVVKEQNAVDVLVVDAISQL